MTRINKGMKKSNKDLIESLKAILSSDDEMKKDRTKMLIDIGFFGLNEKEKASLLNPKPTRKKKTNGTKEETNRDS
jgi:hypothetical protein